jgi:hypothetical protein
MSLVEELHVSLKDFLPEKGVTVTYGEGPAVTIVSLRLHQELKRYAETNCLSLGAVIAQLHHEVHESA